MRDLTYTLTHWDNSYISHDRGTIDDALNEARQIAEAVGSIVKIIDHDREEGLDVCPDGSVSNWYDTTPFEHLTDKDLSLYYTA